MKGKLLTVVLSLVVLSVATNTSYGWVSPEAVLDAEPEYVILGKSVTLDGSGSFSNIVQYEWDFTNDDSYDYTETSSSCPDGAFDGKTTHAYEEVGTYTAKLRVTSNHELTDTDTCTVYVSVDGDGDDLPDGWETANSLDPNDVNDADTDLDGDGYNNLSEYLHYTDPNDSNNIPNPNYPIMITVPGYVNSIQRAINACITNDTIVVEPGRYVENLCFTDNQITLTSVDPNNPGVVATTIIDGNDANNVIIFDPNNANSVITGFTITNGLAKASQGAYSDNGGGIHCDGVSPTISHCVITGNEADDNGGAIYCDGGSPTISNCVISGNTVGDYGNGGGMYNDSSSPSIHNCIFSDNEAYYYGGGIFNYNSSPPLLNCVFSKNVSKHAYGGGIYNNSSSDPNLTNCILWDNNAAAGTTEGKQIYGGTPVINYCCIKGWTGNLGGTGNTGANPCFVDSCDPNGPDGVFGTLDDGLILSVNASPCIDVGDNNAVEDVDTDIIGNARKADGDHNDTAIVDMGAYELPTIWFVDVNADPNGDGTSWDDAFDDLQDALPEANDGDEIWVTYGTYKPHDSNQCISFELVEDVGVYGGFDGNEVSHGQRDWTSDQTILSGDIDTGGEDDSYHVVEANDGAILDGFTITSGNADGSTGKDVRGAGIYCDSVSFMLGNCAIIDNKATRDGGGMYCEDSSPTVTNCTFANNSSYDGAGVYNTCYSESGESYPVFINCVFSENTSSNVGGGIFFAPPFSISAELTNCTFYGNQAYQGGGMVNVFCNMPVTNCIFWGNTATVSSQICTYYEYNDWKPVFSHCDIEGCGGSGEYWDSDLGADAGGNIDGDPCFANPNNPAGPDGVFATIDDGLQLQTISPCIDEGDDIAIDTAGVITDIIGNPRKIDGDKDTEAVVDMGAYEYDTFIVKNITQGIEYTTITSSMNEAAEGDTIVVSEGTYYENIDFETDSITLTSIDPYDPCVVNETIIDGNTTGSAVTFSYGNVNSVITGFTITGGDYCRGILCGQNVSSTISNCTISNNGNEGIRNLYGGELTITNCSISDNGGAGITVSVELTITNCSISNNGGAGITVGVGEHTISNCMISNNQGTGLGGSNASSTISGCIINNNGCNGVDWTDSNIELTNCVIAKNSGWGVTVRGGGVDKHSIINCTIVGNQSMGIITCDGNKKVEVINCILWDNDDDLYNNCFASYSCVEDGDTGWGNFSIDPMFVDADSNDFHLLGWSRCIDWGDPCSDYSNESNGGGGRINVGAYGNTEEAALQTDEGDGLPDEWQQHYWPDYDPNNPDPNYDPNGNPDGDDFSNWVEYLFGYDPNEETTKPMKLLVGLNTTRVVQIDPTKGETLTIDYVLNMGTGVDVDISFIKTDDAAEPNRTIRQQATAGVMKQALWDGTNDNDMVVERYFYDISVDADDGSSSTNWTSPNMSELSASADDYVVDSNDFDPYQNIPVKIGCYMTNWCTRSIDVVKDGHDVNYFWGNDKDRIHHLVQKRLLNLGWNTFYWYGRWGANVNDPNAGPDRKICEEAFDVYFDVRDNVKEGVVLVYYGDPITNLRCNPYRIIPTYDEVTTITYDLASNANVTIDIYDPDGNYFGTLLDDEPQSAGSQDIIWHGTNKDPNDPDSRYILTEGVYLLEIRREDVDEKLKGAIMVHR